MTTQIAKTVAEGLLKINAVKLQPNKPFTWASGWYSPIYCDNRKTLAFPELRNKIRDGFVEIIQKSLGDFDVIAGVATGAIAHGAFVADKMNKPFCYVRSSPKGHGLENLIEGHVKAGQKVIVIEDLISTGGSSLKAVEVLRNEGCEVVALLAIFSYDFDVANKSFDLYNCKLITLSNYETMIQTALELDYIQASDIEILQQWRANPASWNK